MKEEGPFVVFNCLCRQSKDLQEDPCKISDIRRCCIALNNVATAALELYPSAKEVSKDELLELLDEYRENGFLLQPENCKTPKFMCVCCGCCCHALMYLKKLHRPVDYWISNYYAQVNLELCNGCGDCLDRCQLDAITLVNNCSSINLDRCLGCGNCVITCNQKAIILNKKKKPTIPKKSHISLYMSLFLKKRGFFGLLKMLFGYILGYKV
jgi:ferredoxin